jgi:hypothetical protein
MPISCLPKELVNKLKQGVRAGDFNIADLVDMPTQERKNLFKKYVPSEMADFINSSFEKAKVSSWKGALSNWVKKTFVGDEKKLAKDITERIDEIQGFLNDGQKLETIEDIVAQKLGVVVTPDEIARITDFSNQLKELRKQDDQYGNPTEEYFIKRKELLDYLNEINPNSDLKVAISVIGRGMMLFSIKSPFLNIESNTIFGATALLSRRLAMKKFNGLNSDQIIDYVKYATSLYNKTGYDINIMEDIATDFVIRGEKITHSQGPGAIRKVGRFFENFVFRKGQGVPDIFAESFQFADVINLESSRMALREGLTGEKAKQRAMDLMKDALKIYPETDEGLTLRQQAKMEALYYTYKNKSAYSELGLKSREVIDNFGKVFGIPKAGEAIAPFVKTPANVVGAGINMSGGYGIRGLIEVYKGFKERKFSMGQKHFQQATALFVQQGLGLIFAFLVASMFDDDDYMPDYLSASADEKSFAKQAGIPFNSIKIMGHWVSFDYFGPLGSPIKALIHARKYGDTPVEKMYLYGTGVLSQMASFPGLQNLIEFMDNSAKTLTGRISAKEMMGNFYNETIDFVSSRFVPAILGDLAKAIDQSERKAEGPGKIITKIPVFRETLPEKIDIFGTPVKTEPFLSVLFLGSRVKTVNDDPIYTELERLLEQGELPTLSDITKTSSRVKLMKEKLGEKEFNEMIMYFGNEFRYELESEFSSGGYDTLTDEEKKDRINEIKDEILDDTLDNYGYKWFKEEKDYEDYLKEQGK